MIQSTLSLLHEFRWQGKEEKSQRAIFLTVNRTAPRLPYDCKQEKDASDHRCSKKYDPGPADAGVRLHRVGCASIVAMGRFVCGSLGAKAVGHAHGDVVDKFVHILRTRSDELYQVPVV